MFAYILADLINALGDRQRQGNPFLKKKYSTFRYSALKAAIGVLRRDRRSRHPYIITFNIW